MYTFFVDTQKLLLPLQIHNSWLGSYNIDQFGDTLLKMQVLYKNLSYGLLPMIKVIVPEPH